MGLQPLILFSDHLFSFFAHLPVEPKFFLLATSQSFWNISGIPLFCRLSHRAISKTTEIVHPLKCVGTYLFKDPKSFAFWVSFENEPISSSQAALKN